LEGLIQKMRHATGMLPAAKAKDRLAAALSEN
jgi:hypothetical protein